MSVKNLCFIFLILLLGCSTVEKNFDQKSVKLAKNQSPSEVESHLGLPTKKELTPRDIEIWSYGPTRQVTFKKNKLAAFGVVVSQATPEPNAIRHPSPTPEPEYNGPPKGVGESCKKDKECQSTNCHAFKRVCAGPTNCTIPLNGKGCGGDKECCTGRCEFGICKN